MIRRWKTLRTVPPMALVDPDGARAAVISARQHLADEQRRTGTTTEVATRLKALQEKNHFGELLTLAYYSKGIRDA